MAAWFFAGAAALQVFSGAEQFRVQQLGIEANISQLGSNVRTLRIDKQISALQREAGRSAAGSQQALIGVEQETVGKERGFLRIQSELQVEEVGLNRRTFETRRLAERSKEAFERGQVRLGIANITAKARIETATAAFIGGLGGGQTSFTRAFSQASINASTTAKSQLEAAQLRGLLSAEEAGVARKQFGVQLKSIDLSLERGLSQLFGREESLDIRSGEITSQEGFAEQREEFTQERFTEQIAETKRQRAFQQQSRARGIGAQIAKAVGKL